MCHFTCILIIKLCTISKVWANNQHMEVFIKYVCTEIFKCKAAYKIYEINILKILCFTFRH